MCSWLACVAGSRGGGGKPRPLPVLRPNGKCSSFLGFAGALGQQRAEQRADRDSPGDERQRLLLGDILELAVRTLRLRLALFIRLAGGFARDAGLFAGLGRESAGPGAGARQGGVRGKGGQVREILGGGRVRKTKKTTK